VTEATDTTATKPARQTTKGGALGGKVLAELQEIAKDLGISGAAKMRKGALIDAIKEARGEAPQAKAPVEKAPVAKAAVAKTAEKTAEKATDKAADAPAEKKAADKGENEPRQQGNSQGNQNQNRDRQNNQGNQGGNQGGQNNQNRQGNQNRQNNQGGQNKGNQGNQGNQNRQGNQNNQNDRFDDLDGNGRRRNRRGRNRGAAGRGLDDNPTFTEEDVLVPAAGILDILDNYAFVRTTGYLPSENDVYLSKSLVSKLGLRRGDAIVGQVRQPREGERKEKFNPMVKVDLVNGAPAEESKGRVEFAKLTPLYPSERLRLESEAGGLTGRVIDLIAPIGKGQRGLIVSPPKAGKTMVMQQIANAITANNPEVPPHGRPRGRTSRGGHRLPAHCQGRGHRVHLRPARPKTTPRSPNSPSSAPSGWSSWATTSSCCWTASPALGRAYNLAAPGVGPHPVRWCRFAALYPPKKFFGAARNIENGGSLTILATALVETGSRMDEVIFEEFKGTGNMELRCVANWLTSASSRPSTLTRPARVARNCSWPRRAVHHVEAASLALRARRPARSRTRLGQAQEDANQRRVLA
jgi:transcription termination factor Rho